jgi:thiol-disulfide isomerase/thioredoxin
MNNIVKLFIVIAAVLLLGFLKIALDTREETTANTATVAQTDIEENGIELDTVEAGDSMPPFVLKTEEGQLKSSDLRGAYVLEFIATTCPYCKASAPAFEKVFRDSKTPYLVVSAIGEPLSVMRSWKRDYLQGTDAIVATDPGDLVQELSLRGTPTTVFVDRDGKIAALYPGEIREGDIRSLLARIE